MSLCCLLHMATVHHQNLALCNVGHAKESLLVDRLLSARKKRDKTQETAVNFEANSINGMSCICVLVSTCLKCGPVPLEGEDVLDNLAEEDGHLDAAVPLVSVLCLVIILDKESLSNITIGCWNSECNQARSQIPERY